MNFSKEIKIKVREYLKANFGLEPSDIDVLETCQSLFYLGRARARYLENKIKKKGGATS